MIKTKIGLYANYEPSKEKGNPIYESVYTLAKMTSEAGRDIVTGDGPGLMNPASEGHHPGRENDNIHSFGSRIELPVEDKEAAHLDIKKEFYRFSKRFDTFMCLSNATVVASGGVRN